MERDICIRDLKAVERNYRIAFEATRYYYRQCLEGAVFPLGFRPRDVMECADMLQAPFHIELFARFEAILRDYWTLAVRDTQPPARELLAAIASRLYMRTDVLAYAHQVREHRNFLVHARHGLSPQPIALAEARKYLCQYLANLPRHW